MERIKETIVVEGRDDKAAVLAAVDANVICTHGYGIKASTMDEIKKANELCGIIVFTDPDHAGQKIREKILSICPNAKEAFLTRKEAFKKGDIGIENACPKDILKALKAAAAVSGGFDKYSMADMQSLGLVGLLDSSKRREELGKRLGIGSGNAKAFLKKLNYMNIDESLLIEFEKDFGKTDLK